MRPTTFAFAEKIGTGLAYCADDNTYTEYTFTVNAWACPIRAFIPETNTIETAPDIFAAMLG